VAAGRLLSWFAVAFGAGIVLYFTAEREPALWAAAALTGVAALAAMLLRRQIVAHVVALGAFALCLGFTVATLKTSLIDHNSASVPHLGCDGRRLRRIARGKPAHRPVRAAGRPHRRWPLRYDRRQAAPRQEDIEADQ
jgi:hypothetical protein